MTTRVIDVFADVGCPFTHVGLRRFVDRRAELGRTDVRLHVKAWPLEIVNGHPLDPTFIAEEVDDIRNQAAGDLFRGFDPAAFPATSVPALALTAAAYEVGEDAGERVSLRVRELLFEQGVDVADEAVLRAVADEHGVAWADVDEARGHDEHEEGVRRGVVGSPHFFTPQGDFFCPALDVHRDDAGHLLVRTDPGGFERFLSTCFG